MDYKNIELAKMIVEYSLKIKKGDKIFIKYKSDDSILLVKQIIFEIEKKGGIAFLYKYNKELEDILQSAYNLNNIDDILNKTKFDNAFYDVFVSIGSNDPFVAIKKDESTKFAINEFKRRKMKLEKLKEEKRWLLLNYPSRIDAKNMKMSFEDYYKYAFDAMTFDFIPLLDSIEELKYMLSKATEIKIIGDNVDLVFYKENIPSIALIGNKNLPDGEVYTAPIKDSVNGIIKYNVPSPKSGLIFENIFLKFHNGKVIDFDCNKYRKKLEEILSIDDGAAYIGEFAFGFNPKIFRPMNDILYDEKLCKSFHIALGNSYPDAYNGNNSALHWDMIYWNQPGNECDIYFDGELINSKGIFVPNKIRKLNMSDVR